MNIVLRQLQLTNYLPAWTAMREFTQHRDEHTSDELWVVEHPPVFTQGQAGKAEYLIQPGDIPVIQTDRGGQVTYHGPGQLVAYTLVDLRRRSLGIRNYVCELESILIKTLEHYGIQAERRCGAPGVYVQGAKIASLGLRVRHGRAYHGIALNVAMDLEPFSRIHPCGLQDITVTQIKDFVPTITLLDVTHTFIDTFCRQLGYNPLLSQETMS